MNALIDKLIINEKNLSNLSRIKSRTNFKHNNHVCRWALVVSLLIKNEPPPINKSSNVNISPIEWNTFVGKYGPLYLSLLRSRLKASKIKENKDNLENELAKHVTRGLTTIASNKNIGYSSYRHPELPDYPVRNCHLLLKEYLGKKLSK